MMRGIRTSNLHSQYRPTRPNQSSSAVAMDMAWYRAGRLESRGRRVFLAGVLFAGLLAALLLLGGCSAANRYDPELATRPYPYDLHTTNTVDIQLFRDETEIELVNSTATTYRNFDLWLNQRYVARVDELAAGGTIRLSLWDFYDELGESINAGGFFRTRRPDKVRLAEMQFDGTTPMIGLITVRAEDVRRREAIR